MGRRKCLICSAAQVSTAPMSAAQMSNLTNQMGYSIWFILEEMAFAILQWKLELHNNCHFLELDQKSKTNDKFDIGENFP